MTATCETCRHCLPITATHGECRHGPPTVVSTGHRARFPVVAGGDWCGQHSPRDPEATPKRAKKLRTVEAV